MYIIFAQLYILVCVCVTIAIREKETISLEAVGWKGCLGNISIAVKRHS